MATIESDITILGDAINAHMIATQLVLSTASAAADAQAGLVAATQAMQGARSQLENDIDALVEAS